jgi:hypothetical protein
MTIKQVLGFLQEAQPAPDLAKTFLSDILPQQGSYLRVKRNLFARCLPDQLLAASQGYSCNSSFVSQRVLNTSHNNPAR